MAGLSRKLGRRYQRYTHARQLFDEKDDDPKEIWQRMITMSDILSAIALDSQTNEIFPLHGLNNITRNEMNTYAREYFEMAMDLTLNLDPSDEVKLLRIRNDQRELVIGYDQGTIFAVLQSLVKEKTNHRSTMFSVDFEWNESQSSGKESDTFSIGNSK